MSGMFNGCSSLNLINLGKGFTAGKELPDKTWYNENGDSFTPETIPVGIADTYATSMDLFAPLQVQLSETTKTLPADAEPFTLVATATPAWKAGAII